METLQPKLRFPEFKGDWKKKKIDDVSELTSSKRVYLSDYVEKGIPFYRGKEITELKQNKQPSDILYITEKSYIEFKSKYGVPQINDILMTAVGTLGNVYKIKDNNPFYFKDGNLIWFKDIKESSDFLEILLDYKNNDIQKTSIGSTQRALTMVELRKLFFFFPSPQEQTKIANFLSAVDEKLNLLKEKKALLEEYKKGIMQKIFNQEIRFKDDDGNEFEDWVEKKIGNILSIGSGRDYKHLNSGNVPVYGTGGLMTYVDSFLHQGETVCIGRKGTIDKPMYFNRDIWTVDTLFYTHTFVDSVPKYVFYVFQSINWKQHNEASGVPSLSKSTIEQISINVSSAPEQTKIANFLSAIDEKIALVSNQIQDTQEYKKGLLQQMFV